MNRKIRTVILLVLVAVLLIGTLVGCGTKKGNCDLCGQYGNLRKYETVLGTAWICDSCYSSMKAIGSLLG